MLSRLPFDVVLGPVRAYRNASTAVLTAMGLEKVLIASEVNFKANDISCYQSSDGCLQKPVPQEGTETLQG